MKPVPEALPCEPKMDRDASKGSGTVGKALEVLDAVADFQGGVRFAELQAVSPYPKATLYRLVQTLLREGMLDLDPETQKYRMGIRLVRLAHAAWQQSSLAPIARPHLDRLSAQIGETVHLAQLDHAQVLYVDKRNASKPVEMYSQAGKVGPAYCTGVGKVLLAHVPEDQLDNLLNQQSYHRFTRTTHTTSATLKAELKQIRLDGHGFDREEHEPGIICISVPILTQSGRCLGALSLTGSTNDTSIPQLESHLVALSATATAIANDTQAWRFPDAKRT